MRTLLFTALSLANLAILWSPDVLPNSWFAWTVLREGNVDYDEFTRPPVSVDRDAYFFRACGVSTFAGTPSAARSIGGPPPPGPNDRVCSVFPPGAELLALPLFAPIVVAGAGPDQLALILGIGKIVGALEDGLAAPPLEGLYGVLLSPSRGLFVYSPFLLFAIAPFLRAWRERGGVALLLRWLGVATVALVVAYALYAEWWGGRVYGARFLTDALPA